jgi:hypothetical protein
MIVSYIHELGRSCVCVVVVVVVVEAMCNCEYGNDPDCR